MHALHVVRVVLGFSESFFLPNLSLFCGFRSLKHLQQRQSSIGPLYYEEFLDLASPPRAKILRKYAQYSVVIVNTDGTAAVQHLISSSSGANSYQGQPSPRIYCTHSLQTVTPWRKCNHTLNRSQAEVHRMQHSGCSKERFLDTDYAVKTFVKNPQKIARKNNSIKCMSPPFKSDIKKDLEKVFLPILVLYLHRR